MARDGKAWLGMALHGKAWHGIARHGKLRNQNLPVTKLKLTCFLFDEATSDYVAGQRVKTQIGAKTRDGRNFVQLSREN